ncbi:hypothetical protein COCON_G00104880 [Conger conger]|uniref:Uncharacterized protein n=1 Tax=Conger conger TaxID=82655 RepID=A0A9Q1DIL2_CONCO|nr:hypothetical protein COCON_G00104880 [Conger conger]
MPQTQYNMSPKWGTQVLSSIWDRHSPSERIQPNHNHIQYFNSSHSSEKCHLRRMNLPSI